MTRKLTTSLFSFAVLLTFIGIAHAEVVTPNDLESSKIDAYFNNKWFIYNDETDVIDNSLATFVTGPDTAPAGLGSVQMTVSGSQRKNIATYRYKGTVLADITELKFSTYNPSLGNGGSTERSGYLHFNVDFNGTDTWQRRLVFVPKLNGTVMQDTWQEWDALQDGAALWLYSGATWPVTGEPGSTPKTWSQILADYPGVRIRVTDSFLGIRVGEPYADGYTENVDLFKLTTTQSSDYVDFEPLVGPPTDKNECKKDGWMMFNNPSFKNQGQCVSYVVTH